MVVHKFVSLNVEGKYETIHLLFLSESSAYNQISRNFSPPVCTDGKEN